ncbi:MAG: hypothetical protein WBN86_10370 [Porticoccaceae bacterium]
MVVVVGAELVLLLVPVQGDVRGMHVQNQFGWRLAVGGWRLAVGGWRLAMRCDAMRCDELIDQHLIERNKIAAPDGRFQVGDTHELP